MKTAAEPGDAGRITIHNLLHPGHRYQAVIEQVFRRALGNLPGPWDVSAYPFGRAWFRIDVVAPDGAKWSLSVPAQEGPSPDDLTDTVRAACLRHGRLERGSGRRRGGRPSVSPPVGPDGALK